MVSINSRWISGSKVRATVGYSTELINQAEFLVADNAPFDRAFVERLYPQVRGKFWACSMRGIPWQDMGFPSRGLQNLLRDHGILPEQVHRGAHDAMATLSLLAQEDSTGTYYFQYLVAQFECQVGKKRVRTTASPNVAGQSGHSQSSPA